MSNTNFAVCGGNHRRTGGNGQIDPAVVRSATGHGMDTVPVLAGQAHTRYRQTIRDVTSEARPARRCRGKTHIGHTVVICRADSIPSFARDRVEANADEAARFGVSAARPFKHGYSWRCIARQRNVRRGIDSGEILRTSNLRQTAKGHRQNEISNVFQSPHRLAPQRQQDAYVALQSSEMPDDNRICVIVGSKYLRGCITNPVFSREVANASSHACAAKRQ